MGKIKLVFWLILLGLLGTVFWQNRPFFLMQHDILMNFGVAQYQTPALQIALYFLIFFLAGLLISYFSSLSERFVARKAIRKLHEELNGAQKKIAELESAMASLQAVDTGPDVGIVPEQSGDVSGAST